MIGFVMVGTNDLDKAINYYDALLESIDLKRAVTNEKYAGYSSKERPEDIEFYVTNPVDKKKATYGNGTQISFAVKSKERPEDIEFYVTNPANKEKATYGNGAQISFVVNSKEMVDKFYNLGIKLGGKDEGGPGIRPSSEYYCYLRDLDGNKICAFVKINN